MLNATLTRRIEVTPELLILQIKPDFGVPDFLPGQYVALGLLGSAPRPENFPPEKEIHAPDKIIKRAYSIGSPASQKDYVEFYVAVAPEGALTSRLVMLREGDRLFMTPKITGTFSLLGVPSENNLIFVSTGTGIAPYMSMLRTESTWTEGRTITLIHGVRFSKDFAYSEELQGYQRKKPNFKYQPIVSRADANWKGERGYVQKFFNEKIINLDLSRDHVFMCGNPAMIEDTEKLLLGLGYSVHSKKNPEGKLHLEKYW